MNPTTPPAATDLSSRPKPSRGWYGLALVLMVVGVFTFTASLNVAKERVAQTLGQLQQFTAPGSVDLEFEQPGEYLIYYEKVGQFNGQSYDTSERFPELPKMDVDVVQKATGRYLPIERAVDTGTHMYGNGAANSEFGFHVKPEMLADGGNTFTITLTHLNDIDDQLLMAVGPPVVSEGLFADWRGPFGGAAVLAFTFTFGALIVLLTWVLRNGKVTTRGE